MILYLLFINKEQILTVYNVLIMYPLDNILVKELHDNCIDIETDLSENLLNETLKDFFYKIGFYNTFLILDTSLDFEVIL